MLLKLLLCVGLLCLAATLNLTSLSVILILTVLRVGFSKRLDRWFLLGAATAVLPLFGSGTLLAVALIFLLLEPAEELKKSLIWATPFLLVLAFWSVAQTCFGFDLQIFRSLYHQAGGWQAISKFLRESPAQYLLSTQQAFRWLACASLIYFLGAEQIRRERFFLGLLGGIFAAIVITLLQVNSELKFPNQSEFWDSLSRFPGSFTDPNAFGVFTALAIPFIALYSGRFRALVFVCGAGLIVVAALFSGSRTLFLGLFTIAVMALYRWLGKRVVALALVLIVASLLLLNSSGFLTSELYRSVFINLPSAATRILEALSLDSIAQTFHSRIVFWRIALAVWLDNPIFGVGAGEFRSVVAPYAQTLNLGIGSWTDNANSFYLGILAELGVVGFGLFLLSVSVLEIRRKRDSLSSAGLLSFAGLVVMLFFGPHLDFDEISILSSFVISSLAVPVVRESTSVFKFQRELETARCVRQRIVFSLLYLTLAALIFLMERSSAQGFYAWELDADKELYRWSGPNSAFEVSCTVPNSQDVTRGGFLQRKYSGSFVVQSLDPSVGAREQVLTLSFLNKEVTHRISDNNPHPLVVDCGYADRVRVRMHITPVWSPLSRGMSDPRVLGVILK